MLGQAEIVLDLPRAAAARRGREDWKLVILFNGYPIEFPPLANGGSPGK
jgi:hypothetical protein